MEERRKNIPASLFTGEMPIWMQRRDGAETITGCNSITELNGPSRSRPPSRFQRYPSRQENIRVYPPVMYASFWSFETSE